MIGRVVVVTGTSTDVGKTIATAALAATARGSVIVVKPVQTGIGDGVPGDVDVVHALTGASVQELYTLDEPLAPETAARRAGVRLPDVADHVSWIRAMADLHDTVVVEGAGGLMVRLDSEGRTLLDVAEALKPLPLEVVVVCSAGLGTLNHAELTVMALRARGIEPAGLVIGSWPREPDLAESCNLEDLPRVTGVPLLAVIPAGAGSLSAEDFVARAPGWFDPAG